MMKSIVLPNRWLGLALGAMLYCAGYAADPAPGAGSEDPAQNSIDAIDVVALQGGSVAVKITFKQALANPPAGFSINNPPRIAFDFPNTANALGKNTQQVDKSGLRSINIVQAGGRTRLVMNLARPFGYDTKIDGKYLVVTLQTSETGATVAPVASRFAEARPSDKKHSVRDIDFRRGPNGEGRVIIDLSDTSTGIDLRQQGKNIVIDLINTSLPTNLERRLDVTDFATPVQTVDAFTDGENVRIVVEPKGLWQQSAYQADNRFTLEVKLVIEEPGRLVQGGKPGYSGEKLSLNFQNVEVRAVLQVIADFTGLNIITSDSVTGNLTLRLKDVPWDQALEIILQSKGLDLRKNGNVVWIAPRDELATKEKIQLESLQQISDLEPTHTESFQVNYQKADAVQKLLTDPQQKLLSKRGSVVVDSRTNMLFVQDTSAKLDEVRNLIKKIDVPVRQVIIEARIVQANDDFSKNLGVKFGYQATTGVGGAGGMQTTLGGDLATTAANIGERNATASPIPGSLSINLPAGGISGAAAGALSLVLFNSNITRFLNLELSALEADARGKIISNPKVVTADQVEAVIEQGTEIPYQLATSSGATAVSFKKANLSLRVKPQITPDDNVIMNLQINNDARGTDTTAGPAINTKSIQTQVLVENGGTVVIGGIYVQDQQTTINKVPLLGDIPYLGVLFKSTSVRDNKSELLIFITPRILKDSLTIR